MTKDDKLVEQLIEDYTRAPLGPADRAMLDYATKLTRTPASTTRQDVETLRANGFDDRAILDIVQVVSYFAFANRLTDGLGVAVED